MKTNILYGMLNSVKFPQMRIVGPVDAKSANDPVFDSEKSAPVNQAFQNDGEEEQEKKRFQIY